MPDIYWQFDESDGDQRSQMISSMHCDVFWTMTDSIVTHFIHPNERKVTKCNYYLIIARKFASDCVCCVRIEWFRANNWVSDITLIPRLFPRVQRLKIGNFLQIFSGHFTGSDFELIFWMSFANYPIQTKTLTVSLMFT